MAPKRSTKAVSKKAESSRVPAPHDARIAVIAALVFSLLVAVGLPLIYLLYLRRLEKDKCDCATEHYLFQRLKMIVVAQLALVILLPITMLVSFTGGLPLHGSLVRLFLVQMPLLFNFHVIAYRILTL